MPVTDITFCNHQEERLSGTLHQPSGPSDKGVVLSHCFTCSQHTSVLKDIAEALAQKGFWALRFDFSGNGRSEGDFSNTTYSKHAQEVEMGIKYLKEKGVRHVGLAGHSMGGTLSLITAYNQLDIRAVCTLGTGDILLYPEKFLGKEEMNILSKTGKAPFVSRGRQLTIQTRFFKDANTYDLKNIIKTLDMPLLIIHCENDNIIPVKAAETLYQIKKSPKDMLLIPGGDHMFIDKSVRKTAADHAAGFFEKYV